MIVRNLVAGLEELGFLESPDTSSGRVPTGPGYGFCLDSLITVETLATPDKRPFQGLFFEEQYLTFT